MANNPFDEIDEKLSTLSREIASLKDLSIQKEEIIDRAELLRRLNITEPTAIRWEKRGKIPCFRIGSSVRYNWNRVLNSLQNQK